MLAALNVIKTIIAVISSPLWRLLVFVLDILLIVALDLETQLSIIWFLVPTGWLSKTKNSLPVLVLLGI